MGHNRLKIVHDPNNCDIIYTHSQKLDLGRIQQRHKLEIPWKPKSSKIFIGPLSTIVQCKGYASLLTSPSLTQNYKYNSVVVEATCCRFIFTHV